MPIKLDEIDIAVLESLSKDGRKSFRQISREIKVSTPTVKARYQRLVNVGLIMGVFPRIDLGMLEGKTRERFNQVRTFKDHKLKIDSSMAVKITCEYCKGPISARPIVLRFADQERFFCCSSCRALYKEKHKSRIEAISNLSKDRNH